MTLLPARSRYRRGKKADMRYILIGLGVPRNEALASPTWHKPKPLKQRGFRWADWTGAEVAGWIQALYKKAMRGFPDEGRVKELNILRDEGLKICRFH